MITTSFCWPQKIKYSLRPALEIFCRNFDIILTVFGGFWVCFRWASCLNEEKKGTWFLPQIKNKNKTLQLENVKNFNCDEPTILFLPRSEVDCVCMIFLAFSAFNHLIFNQVQPFSYSVNVLICRWFLENFWSFSWVDILMLYRKLG